MTTRIHARRISIYRSVGLVSLSCAALITLAGCAKKSEAVLSVLRNDLLDRIRAADAEVSIACKDLETGELLLINEDQSMHAASTMKVPVMIEVLKQSLTGGPELGDSLVVRNEFKSIVDGSPYAMDIGDDSGEQLYDKMGQNVTIEDLVVQMITVSSNLATNILIDLVGAKNIMATLEALGIRQMQVLRGVEDIKAFNRGLNNTTTARDLMNVMEAIAVGKAGTAEHCQKMIEILGAQKFREKIPAGIPPGIVVANKTGSISRIDHDAAIIFPPGRRPLILVILTRGFADQARAQAFIASLARNIYQAVVGDPTADVAR